MLEGQKLFHLPWFLPLVLSLITGLFLIQKINLPAADIGRHLVNGQLIWQTGLSSPVLYQNFYSYTQPEFNYPNHHWLYGVIIWPIKELFGAAGLILLNAGLIASSVWLIFRQQMRKEKSALLVAWLIALPLVAWRTEVRPESFSLLFLALITVLLNQFAQQKIKPIWLILILVTIMIFWVNTHLFFPLGIGLVGFELIKNLIVKNKQITNRKTQIQVLSLALLAMIGATLVNPNTWRGALVPFTIFQHYPYPVAENQTTLFFFQYYPNQTIYWYFLVWSVINLIILIGNWPKRHLVTIMIESFWTIGLITAGLIIVRVYPVVALLSLPSMIHNLDRLINRHRTKLRRLFNEQHNWLFLSPTIVLILLAASATRHWLPNLANFGLDFQPGSLQARQFLQQLPAGAKIFNNYDVGGYLIYQQLTQQVFVDNRPESYSPDFMKDWYIKPQQNDQAWNELVDRYQLNIIFFYRHDATDWAQPFLIKRLSDPEWVPVYVDAYFLAFAKKSPKNSALIEQLRIPQDYFQVSQEN